MTTPLDIEYFIGQIYRLDEWLKAFPLTQEYRERTTYREFRDLQRSKEAELGLTREVFAQLREIRDNGDLNMARLELGMTEDHRELVCSTYELDLPLNYHWMPEYESVRQAVEDFWDTQPSFESAKDEDEALLEVVRKHMPAKN